jgi:hypothetical protein
MGWHRSALRSPSITIISGSTVNTTYRLTTSDIHHLVLRVTDKKGATAQLNVTLIVRAQGVTTTKTIIQVAPWSVWPLVLIIVAVVATIVYRIKRS